MYTTEDLFGMQDIVATKLDDILLKNNYTKSYFCNMTGISRPTLDKLLSASIASKTNYEKHMSKILKFLNITPDILMGNIKNPYSKINMFKDFFNMGEKELAKFVNVPIEKLREIMSGGDAPLAMLRDIALAFNTSVRCILGTNFFHPQLSVLCSYTENRSEFSDMGFWGHIGIRPASTSDYLWYPITKNTRNIIQETMDNDQIIIPCMNNKVLYVNLKNIDNIIMLDDACDQPSFTNWDSGVSCGEHPLVVYEALEDYLYYQESEKRPPHNEISSNLYKYLDKFIKEHDEEIAYLPQIKIYYSNEKIEENDIDFYEYENITSEISGIYEFGENISSNKFLYYCSYDGIEVYINRDKISIIELPLIAVEEKICKDNEEILDEI